jgi:hypothetical protein
LQANNVRRESQQFAHIEEGKRPGTIIGYGPAVSVEIEFSLDLARRTMKSAQILRGLFEDAGRQIFLARLGLVIVGKVHVDFVCYFFLKLSKIDISEI